MPDENRPVVEAGSCRLKPAFFVVAFLLETVLWMRAFWPFDSDPIQILVSVPLALLLTAFSFREFCALLVIGGAWVLRHGRNLWYRLMH